MVLFIFIFSKLNTGSNDNQLLELKPNLTEEQNVLPDNDKDIVEQYISNNIINIVPEDAVLGGTWYVLSVFVDSSKRVGSFDYEDGHVQGHADFSYTIEGEDVVIYDIVNVIG